MAEVEGTGGVRLHVEVDGEGVPVTIFAHGLTNSCRELAMLTPLIEGTKIRFDFRGHGHSGAPDDPAAFTFADMAEDLEAVATAYGATRAIGTSMGAGAIGHILCDRPDRFERIVMLLPAGLDRPFRNPQRFLRYADALETLPKDEAIEAILDDPDRVAVYLASPWLRDVDKAQWEDLADQVALGRAIRGIVTDFPIRDRELMRLVRTPVFLIAREGDAIHPASVARLLDELLPSSELVVLGDEAEMIAQLPMLVQRVREFLA
ncbi:MAG TPA: alpha/beta hydrolase [Actinomycetota bacterium]|nr:alpha/beta hydrolase [Actinomycetota bacterium]